MRNANDNPFESEYRRLKSEGFAGWGGSMSEFKNQGIKDRNRRFFESPLFPKCFENQKPKILELGCGAGNGLDELIEQGYDITGIDISKTAIDWAKENSAGRFKVGSIADPEINLLFSKSEFDVIIDGACLHCITSVEERKQTFQNIFDLLKKDGLFIYSSMVNDPRLLSGGITFDSATRLQVKSGKAYRHMPTTESVISYVESIGFKTVFTEIRNRPWWDHFEAWYIKIGHS